MIWFMSDPHYAHKNIIRGCSTWGDKGGCRDFDTFSAHNTWLVDSINTKVQPRDVLWCLGDWSFGGEHRVREFRDRLRVGHVHLILGNHDQWPEKRRDTPTALGFETIRSYVELKARKLDLVLFHYPMESWNGSFRKSVHLHGHVHRAGDRLERRFNLAPEANWLMSLDDIQDRLNR